MANEFWLNDRQWLAIEPPAAQSTGSASGRRPAGDQRHCSCVKVGYRWEDCPALYGPSTTVYNRFNRWSRRGLWQRLFDATGNNGCGRHADHRQHDGQGPPLLPGAEKGALAQAIGRSRGGRTTEIHALDGATACRCRHRRDGSACGSGCWGSPAGCRARSRTGVARCCRRLCRRCTIRRPAWAPTATRRRAHRRAGPGLFRRR